MQKKSKDVIIYTIICIYNTTLFYMPLLLLFNQILNLNPPSYSIFIRQQLPFILALLLIPLQERYMRNKSNRRKLQITFGLAAIVILLFGYSFLIQQSPEGHILMSFICLNIVLLKINGDCMGLKQLQNMFQLSCIQTIGYIIGQCLSILMFYWVQSNYFINNDKIKSLSELQSFWIICTIGIVLIIVVIYFYKQKMNIGEMQLKHLELLDFYQKYKSLVNFEYRESRFILVLFLLNQGNFIFQWSYYIQIINKRYLQYQILISVPYATILPVAILIYFISQLFTDQNKKYWILLLIVNIKLILNLIFFFIRVDDDDHDILSILYILINSILSFSLLFLQNYLCNQFAINNHSAIYFTVFYLVRSLGHLMPLQLIMFKSLDYQNTAVIGLSLQVIFGLFTSFWVKFLTKIENLNLTEHNTLVTQSEKINPLIQRINK